MRLGFIVSVSLHVALLLWAILSIERTKLDDVPETVAVSVAIVTPSEFTRMKEGDQNTRQLESKAAEKPSDDQSQKEAAKPKAAVAPPPPPAPEPEPVKPEPPKPEPAKVEPPPPDPIQEKLAALPPEKAPDPPPPPPGPTPDELAALAAKQEAERKAEAKAKAEAEKKRIAAEQRKKAEADAKKKKLAEAKAKAEAEKNKFDPNKLADLINKQDDRAQQKALIDKSNKPTGAKPTGSSQTATNLGPSAGTKEGRDSVLSAREADMLNSLMTSALKEHWRLPAGGGGSDTPVVFVKFRLRQDGSLDGEPQVVQAQNNPLFQVAADAAIRAVKESVPFNLPPDKFSAWQDNKVEFDPRKMLQ